MVLFMVVFIAFTFLVFPQSKETGALQGTITLEDGNPVPGVLVTITSETVVGAKKTTITSPEGEYRLVGLQPGTYTVMASLEGFATAKQTGIKVHIGKVFIVDMVLKQGKIEEEVVVMGKSALVDVKTSTTATVEMPIEFLQNVPNAQFTTDAVNLAPGVTNDVAYGAAQGTGILYQIDGVDVKDPAGGTAWVFLDYNVVEEVSVSGIGAPAEYGGFTGVVFNTVTKSGGNQFKVYSEAMYQGKKWNSKNTNEPDLTPRKSSLKTLHLDVGGPIIKDKLSFFLSGLLYRSEVDVLGQNYGVDYKQPKGFLKFSWQPTSKTRVNTFIEYDTYDGTGRGGDAATTEDATVNQKSPEVVFNLSLQHLFSDYTFMEAKFAYFDGYYALNPVHGKDVSGHIDQGTGEFTGNSYYYYRGDRKRLQANISVSHHADDFIKGSHDFKFGVDTAFVTQGDQYGYSGGAYYLDYYGDNYLKVGYEGYDIKGKLNNYSFYAQDSWSIGKRLTINPGVRVDMSRGTLDGVSGTVYKPKTCIAPRIGFTFDILGDHTTAFKAHWGYYYESPYFYTFSKLSKNKGARYVEVYNAETGQFELDPYSYVPGGTTLYSMDENLKQAYMEQLTFGIERQLIKDLSIGITYISRKNHNQIAPVDVGGVYEKVSWYDDYTQQYIDVWTQVNPRSESRFLITNPKKGLTPWLNFDPYRKYSGFEVLLNKRFSNNWQLMVSYVYSKSTGNFDNTQSNGAGFTSILENPNGTVFNDGKLTNDPTHMLKIQGSVILPLSINLNMNFQIITGDTYTLSAWLPIDVDPNVSEVNIKPRGSNRYPTTHTLDLRLEKTVTFNKLKVGILLDIFNLFNEGKITFLDTTTSSGSFGTTLSLTTPRAFRAGLRFWL